ncbi:MAG: cadherin-like domain-containing protein [Verrucomicrobiae bacterium]|nr:cadherin-like domain-containing protein [Verrucomicrobiae bacterium]
MLKGSWGGEIIEFSILYSEETAVGSVDGNDIEFVGLSGDATGKFIPVTLKESLENGGQIWGFYEVGPFDASANGSYTCRLKAGEVHDGAETPVSIPETEFFQFEQAIKDPVPEITGFYFRPMIDKDGNVIYGVQGAMGGEPEGLVVRYSQKVDWDTVDENDIVIEGIAGDALGHVYPLVPEFTSFSAYNQIEWGAFLSFGPLDSTKNGTYVVKLRANEVFDRGDPATALEAQEILTFVQRITTPFSANLEGRVFLETGTPRFTDDGPTVDPGLEVNILLEQAQGGGFGSQWIAFSKTIAGSTRTGLVSTLAEITGAVSGAASTGNFQVSGDQSASFPVGSAILVSGSNGNDGTYTVSTVQFAGETTTLGVEEAVPASGAGGTVSRAYLINLTIDGINNTIAVSGAASEIFFDLIAQLNSALGNKGYVVMVNDFLIAVESPSFGEISTVSISGPGGQKGLLANLPNHVLYPATSGNEDFSFFTQNEFYSEEELEADIGRFEFFLQEPGLYRLRVYLNERFDPNTSETIWEPPFPQWIEQALGDPSRIGFPKDHTFYILANRSRTGKTIIQNAPYVDDTIPPNPVNDAFQVLIESIAQPLDVLRNDEGENLTIIGLAKAIDEDLYPGSESILGEVLNDITTNGQFIFYTPKSVLGLGHADMESFYYIVEDNQGEWDFAKVTIENVTELTAKFAANDDFAAVPITASQAKINVLANDTVDVGVSKEDLVITSITTPTAGGNVSFQGSDVTYFPPPDFLGIDRFDYTITDGTSETATASVSVNVTESPVPDGQRAMLNLLLLLFFGSDGPGAAVYNFFNKHIGELNSLILDQGEDSVSPKASGKVSISRHHNGGTAETQATWNAILDMAESGIAATLAGQGDSQVVTQEFVDMLMGAIQDVQSRGSPDLVADLQVICEMTNDFQDLVGKTYGEGFEILGLPPEEISFPNLALHHINNVLSITTYDVVGIAYKLLKSNNLQPDSWKEVENAEVESTGQTIKVSDPEIGDENAFYRIAAEPE